MTAVYILIAIVLVLLVFAVVLYNRMVRLRNEVDTGWANIDVQLKRRNDLIPNIVEAVKGYAAHERSNVVVLDPDVAAVFRNAGEVNAALRALASVIKGHRPKRARSRKSA